MKLPPSLSSLSLEDRAQLERRLMKGLATQPRPQGIPRRQGTGPVPLSFAQQRLWFLEQLAPGSSAYHVPLVLRARGVFNLDVLRRVLETIVRRHEALRTTFAAVGGEPVQVIGEASAVPLDVFDLRELPEDRRAEEMRRLFRDEVSRPFDLTRDLMVRAAVARLGDDDHGLLLVMHHIAADGWSIQPLVRELTALYQAFAAGHRPALPELTVQYADYAVWQRHWLQGEVLDRQLAYWRKQLDGLAALDLPLDHPRPAMQTFRGGRQSLELPAQLVNSLKILGRDEGVTPFMTLLAAFQALLSRYSGLEDISVGSPIAGRSRVEIERLIGFFVNTLVLRTDLSGRPTFRQLLQRVRETALGAYAHQDVPFEKLVEELAPQRDTSRSPLFDVLFVFQNAPKESLQLPGLSLASESLNHHTAKFDLQLTLSEAAGAMKASVVYNQDLFDEATARRLLDHYRALLTAAVAEPDRPIGALPLFSPAEREQIVRGWNATRQDYPPGRCIPDLVEDQVSRSPGTVAATCGHERLTYEELNRKANQLAHHLRGLGVGPDMLVGLCVERSLDMVVGALGILKAGAAYVPIDANYPGARLAVMLEDAQPAVLLTQERLRDRLPAVSAPVLCLDSDWGTIAQASPENPVPQATPEHLAYVIYTSGSTGKPKGVAMPHRPLVNLLEWQLQSWAYPGPATTLQFASMSFDVSFQEIFSTLASGGTLLILEDDVRQDPAALARLLAAQDVRRAYLPPVVLQHLAEAAAGQGHYPRALREIITAGEALQITRPVARFHQRLPGCVLQNHYGPTEAHVVTAFTLEGTPDTWPLLPPIGRPIANTEIYLLDGYGQPVPPGVPGELHIGGRCLARGYLTSPELTAEKFVPHPFSSEPGARLYHTGDLARYRADGTIEYLGRIDHQVKVRGFRIELGEIEAVLAQHPGVRAAAVLLREDQPGDKRLVAYVAADPGPALSPAALRHFVQDQLPAYMVPAQVVPLEHLPLTPNGKVDRRALPAPPAADDAGAESSQPRTAEEEILAGIFGRVLTRETVGREDNFFELGGHSLLATRVASLVRDAFGIELPLRAVFEAPTVAGLAEQVVALRQSGPKPAAPPLVAVPRQGPLPVSFAQQRLWFLDQMFPGNHLYNVPGAFRLRGRLDEAALEAALTEMVRRHEALRTTFAAPGGEPVQVVREGVEVPLRRVDLRGQAAEQREQELQRLFREEGCRPFDLGRDVMLRALLVRLDEAEWGLLLVMHHIAADGWSLGPFVRELTALYETYRAGQPSPLPELPIQYGDFAVWQRSWLQGEVLEEQLAYWRQQLAGAATLELPLDHPRPPVQSSRAGAQPRDFPPELLASLKRLSRDEGTTLFMTLLAAFQVLLHRYSGQEDISVGSPIAGRNRVETEPLIGFFVNTLVLRTDLSGRPTFRQVLQRVRETALGAYAHQEMPFEKLVEELVPGRDTSRSPLFQVLFTLQNAPGESFKLPDLTLSRLSMNYRTAKFDLQMTLGETADGLKGSLVYNEDLFEDGTARRILEHYRILLEAAVLDPDRPIGVMPLLASSEQEQLITGWNETRRAFPQDVCLHQLVEAQAALDPDRAAVVQEGRSLSYGELNGRANQLARYLRGLGVGPEMLVAVCAERSAEVVVALLGILKAGGAYLPLDPSYPRERLAFMLADSGVSIALTQDHLRDVLPGGVRAVCLDRDWDAIATEETTNLGTPVGPKHLAYVIYTSGSSGKPKGVMIDHAGICNLVHWHQEAYRLSANDRATQLASLSFDASTWEIWPYLASGASVHVVADSIRVSDTQLANYLADHAISMAFIPTPLLPPLLNVPGAARMPLRFLLTGGEKLLPLTAAAPSFPVINHYGPTECAVVTSCGPVDCRSERMPPIGRPIANFRAYILDANLQLVPIGVPGEIFIGGRGVARGYLGRPELTAEKFVPDPFGQEPGARLYGSGDLARYLPDGNMEILGRIDHQVKVRGFRIELGEIEAVLAQHPGVRAAAVLLREDQSGDKRLVAYVAADPGPALSPAALRHFVQDQLPAYMVPAQVVLLEHLPLTPNGKVDRRALPAPPAADEAEREGSEPRTAEEEILAGVFGRVLTREAVGREDNFFELGGHSLLATRVASLVRDAFGIELPLRAVFEAPTVAGLAERVVALRQSGPRPAAPPLVAVPRHGPLPVSFAQQRLWFLDQMFPGNHLYNVPGAFRLRGRLDEAALEAALTEMVRRHEALRTTFAAPGGEPMQVVREGVEVPLRRVDLRGQATEQKEEQLQRLFREEGCRPFDLGRDVMLRALLVRLDEAEWGLLLVMHHIAADGWSRAPLVREVTALYEAFTAGRPSPLPELPIQYGDFAVWQRSWLQGEVLEEQLAYWRQQLAGAATLELPLDHPRPPVQSSRGGDRSLQMPPELLASLKCLSRDEGTTLFMTLLAAFQALLSRYSGQEDISVGSPIAGRNRVETEPLIGFFINTLVLRTDLSGQPTFRQLLQRVRETALGAYAHQDVPFEKLVEELAPQRDTSRSPLFQILFVFQNIPRDSLQLPELELKPLRVDYKAAKYDLQVTLAEGDGKLWVSLLYNQDLFEASTAERLLEHFRTLLEAAVAEPDRPVALLPLVHEAEQHRLLVEWNATRTAYPRAATIPTLFEEQVERAPQAVALVFGDREMTYRELDERANQLAHLLRQRGVRPEVPVALCIERSLEMVVGLLGILKAGGAYVPLDPTYPSARLAFMLQETGAPVVLTQQWLVDKLSPPAATQVICLDANIEEIARQDKACPAGEVGPDNLAYICYTSGSTGIPKGAGIPHRAVVRLVKDNHFAELTSQEVFLQLAPLAFDASTLEIWGPLLNGGRLVIMPPRLPSLEELGQALSRHQVTTLWLTASLFHQVVETDVNLLRPVHQLLAGGDVLSVPLVQKVLRDLSGCRLINGYGPTENTTFTCCHPMTGPSQVGASVPIGRPIANTTVYLLDRHLRPVPVGVPGELYTGGDGLARGYLNRPDLTAERFIPNPFSAEPGARLYRTGDLARYGTDGAIEFLGRIDSQVKVRGFRIELGEIEAVLGQHPAIGECIVLVREDVPSDKRLVAYIVPDPDQAFAITDLRNYLKEKLPPYMVPGAFVAMEQLPLTPNGKVDRKALPPPDPAAVPAEGGSSPRTPLEEIIAGIWAQILRVSDVGISDNFFDLGGHSLLATQVISRIRAAFQVEVPLQAMFETATVAGLAERVQAALRSSQQTRLPPLVPAPRLGPLPLSFAQQRLWFIDQMFPGNSLYNVPMALRLAGTLDRAALEHSLAEVVRRHEALRTTYAPGGEPMQMVGPARPVPLQFIDLRSLPADRRQAQMQRLFREDAHRPFDLSQDLMLRAVVVQLGDEDWGLLIVMHHIAADGWSFGPFVRELTALYDAFVTGRPAALPELPVQYADYALWQRRWLQGEALEQELAYWRGQLQGAATLELPLDHPRPAVQSSRGANQFLEFPPEVLVSLKRLGREEGATLFMTLLAAFQALLHRYTGQEDISVGSPIAGRNRVETEPLIGFFVNTLVMRTDLSGRPTFRQLLQRVREVALGAYAHQDVPFEKLVEELAPQRDTSRSPLFQVLFVLQNTPRESLQLPGLTLAPLPVDYQTAKFGLQITLSEAAGHLRASLLYNQDLFEEATIQRMLGHYRTLLEAAALDPDRALGSLPLLAPAEEHRLLIEWNETGADYPRERTISQLFEDQVARAPQAVALVFGDREVTYRELNVRANQLAHYLRRLGVGPEVPVAVCAERSPEMIVALLAILKAGGAYVPLDASYPRERLAFMLADTRARVLLTESHFIQEIPAEGVHVVSLDTGWEQFSDQSETNPVSGAVAETLAYVVYTSGSSGIPKGVGVPQRAVVRLVKSAGYANLSAQEVFLQFAPVSFDASTLEIWGSLLNGARLVIMPAGVPSLAELGEVLHRHQVTTLWLTAGLFHQMVENGLDGLRPVRQLLAGGDVLAPACVQKVVDELAGCTLINGYGPTENTTFTCCYPVPRSGAVGPSVPIGRPITNTRVYILDRNMQPVPIGVVGELYTSGDGLARGYLHRPDLTAKKFVPNPFSDRPGERLYRTGDLVRYRPDGNIEFLGRRDSQVKVRGFRIELGEIEAVLARHAAVRECAVVIREDSPGDKRLAAYVAVGPGKTATPDELKAFVKEKLPPYMVPAVVMVLERLPLTPNGKVDRRALPAPELDYLRNGQAAVAARTELEKQLAAIWAQVLGVGSVGVHDDFFQLGGHSILAVRLVAEIKQSLGHAIPLVALFQAPTVELLARYIEEKAGSGALPTIVAVQTSGSRPPLFFASQPGINALGYALLARALGPDQPFYVIQPQRRSERIEAQWTEYTARLPRPRTEPVHEAMAAEYIQAMRTVQPQGPYLLGGMCMGAHIAYSMALQLQRQGEEVPLLAILDTESNDTLSKLWHLRRFLNRVRYSARRFGGIFRQRPAAWCRQTIEMVGSGWRRITRLLRPRKTMPTKPAQPAAASVHEVAHFEGVITLIRVGRQQYWRVPDRQKGWGRRSTRGVTVHFVPGEHEMMLREPNVRVVAGKLQAAIARAIVPLPLAPSPLKG